MTCLGSWGFARNKFRNVWLRRHSLHTLLWASMGHTWGLRKGLCYYRQDTEMYCHRSLLLQSRWQLSRFVYGIANTMDPEFLVATYHHVRLDTPRGTLWYGRDWKPTRSSVSFLPPNEVLLRSADIILDLVCSNRGDEIQSKGSLSWSRPG